MQALLPAVLGETNMQSVTQVAAGLTCDKLCFHGLATQKADFHVHLLVKTDRLSHCKLDGVSCC